VIIMAIRSGTALALGALLGLATAGSALAHNSKLVADDQYRVSVGFVNEPIHTGERNGLDLAIRRAGERETIPDLESGLRAELIAPDGKTRREMPIRPRYGHPGRYTFDVVLTEPGVYAVRVWGTIHGAAFDRTFELSEVKPLAELRFPG
jgi:hypothetical protein